jgi:GNAT superfamily N-acetyltransferase
LGQLAELTTQLGYPATPTDLAPRLEHLLASPEHLVLVASRAEGPALAWIHVFLAHRLEVDSFAEIGGLVVDQDLRGSGAGALLVEEAARWAKSLGCRQLRVRSNEIRHGAHAFYLKRGFHLIKTQKIFQRPLP